ncbi:MAG: rhodanese-like domain-containing protein [Dactylosporangium sp.]|nr:rhodanese-like domain-containing protein [Dactylosporangium sp.]
MGIGSALKRAFTKPYATVHPTGVEALLGRSAIVIDVRESSEWRAGRAPKARHIPLDQLAVRMGEIPRGRPVITVCRSGMRSARAAGLLVQQGHEVFNLAGGMRAWARAGLPVTANGGRAGQIV